MGETKRPPDDGAAITADARFVVRGDPASCRLGSESVVLDVRQGTYFGMNDVAARVFELLAQPRTFRELCTAVCAEYAVDPARCDADLRRLIGDLRRHGLIEGADGVPA